MKKQILLFSILFLVCTVAFSQYHKQESDLYFPDINGYQTLKCDFHMHTSFSDGLVWPDYRVYEAIHDGIDVIAITDHLEYLPNKDYINGDFNTSYKIAKEIGDKYGITVIQGAEITRSMPPGHINAIFITDANKLIKDSVFDVVEEAYNQGAFIFWNHPCWDAQQPDTVKWFDIHTRLFDAGYIHGIEVVNFSDFCPEAWNWAMEKDLTILSNSDIHSTTEMSKFVQHRPITLVFATQNEEGAIRKALDDKMTLLYYNENLYGDENLLQQILQESLIIKKRYNKENKIMTVDITNVSSVPVYLKPDSDLPSSVISELLQIEGKSNIHFNIDMSKTKYQSINFSVLNYIYEINKDLTYQLNL